MNQWKNVFFATVLSPELVIVLFALLCFAFFPEVLANAGKNLRADPEVWKYLPSLALLFSGASVGLSSKLRAPLENGSNKTLYDWPLYNLLVGRVMAGLFYAIASSAIALVLWVYGQSLSAEMVGGLFIVSTGVSGVTALTMLLAHQRLRELLEKYSI